MPSLGSISDTFDTCTEASTFTMPPVSFVPGVGFTCLVRMLMPATVTLGPGDYAINPPGAWHTADVEEEAAALFITAGLGTEHRPR